MSFPAPFKTCAQEAAGRSKNVLEIAIQKGARYADFFLEQTDQAELHASTAGSGAVIPQFQAAKQTFAGVAVRAFDQHKQTIRSIAGWNPSAWENAALEVADSFTKTKALKEASFAGAGVTWTEDLPPDAPHAISLDEKKNLLSMLIETAFSYEPTLARASISLKESTRQTLLVNTAGQSVGSASARFGMRIEVLIDTRRKVVAHATRGYNGGFGKIAFDDSAHLVQEVVDRAKQIVNTRKINAGVMPVVFAGGWAGLWLHETVGHLLEADVSPESLSIGSAIGNTALNVFDDATPGVGLGSVVKDDEGVPAERTMLIEKGHIVNLLTDRFYADQLQIKPTGNGRRAHYTDVPLPRMTNLGLMPGTASHEELMGAVQQGLYVKQATAGVHHNETGAFELTVTEGYLIEAGQITHPVNNVIVTGQGLRALQQIMAVGNDMQYDRGFGVCKKAGQVVPVSVNTPTVLIDKLDVWQG